MDCPVQGGSQEGKEKGDKSVKSLESAKVVPGEPQTVNKAKKQKKFMEGNSVLFWVWVGAKVCPQ